MHRIPSSSLFRLSIVSSGILFIDTHNRKYNSLHCNAPVSVATYPANKPIEDRFLANRKLHQWEAAAVFDGHGGWNVSEFAMNHLLDFVEDNLTGVSNDADDTEIDSKIVKAFDQCEESYVNAARASYELGFGSVASVGSCVLVAMKSGNKLVLANCGDCRAVMGSSSGVSEHTKHKIIPTRLTRDHNSREALEVATLLDNHPTESLDELVRCKHAHACYVKGRLQLTRSLGDLYLKRTEFNAPAHADRSRGRHIPEPFDPPYVSHTPDITHLTLAANDRFVILATDGLWDFLSDAEAVEVVSNCLENGISREIAAQMLVDTVLKKAADGLQMTVEELKAVPMGNKRRNKHDDTTAVVIYFDVNN